VGGRELLEDHYFLRPPLPQLTFSLPPLPAACGAASVFAGFAADDVLPVPRAPRAHAVAAQTAHVRHLAQQRHQARSQQRRRMGNSMLLRLQTWLQEGDHLRFSTRRISSMPICLSEHLRNLSSLQCLMGQSNGILRKLNAQQPSSENEPWNVSAPARATNASQVLPDGVLSGPTAEIAARSGDTSPDGMSARGREPRVLAEFA
jgi:hypothetical protein